MDEAFEIASGSFPSGRRFRVQAHSEPPHLSVSVIEEVGIESTVAEAFDKAFPDRKPARSGHLSKALDRVFDVLWSIVSPKTVAAVKREEIIERIKEYAVLYRNGAQIETMKERQRAADAEQRVKDLAREATAVMVALAEHGSDIVPHLLDTDDNAGERLRQLLAKVPTSPFSWPQPKPMQAGRRVRIGAAVKTFSLVRKADVSGVSGTGIVADGALFPDGKVALCWRKSGPTGITNVIVYDAIADVETIHGHNGQTVIEWH